MDMGLVIKAVAQTGNGYYVNIVTTAYFGHPGDFLAGVLSEYFGGEIEMKFIYLDL